MQVYAVKKRDSTYVGPNLCLAWRRRFDPPPNRSCWSTHRPVSNSAGLHDLNIWPTPPSYRVKLSSGGDNNIGYRIPAKFVDDSVLLFPSKAFRFFTLLVRGLGVHNLVPNCPCN